MSEQIGPRGGFRQKVLRHPLSLMAIGFFIVYLFYNFATLTSHLIYLGTNSPGGVAVALGWAVITIATYKLLMRRLERHEDTDLVLPGAARELGIGLAFGFVLFSAMTGLVTLLGGISITAIRGVGDLWTMLTIAILSGLFEEILFRGLLFRHLETLLGSWISLALTSLFFGAAHILNPDATLFSSLAIAVEAGILLGAAYMISRSLWLPIGIHAAWNFTQGWVFSIPVSGGEAPKGLLVTVREGPRWLTGGDFGLEASVVAVNVALFAGGCMLVLAIRRGQVMTPAWMKRQTKL